MKFKDLDFDILQGDSEITVFLEKSDTELGKISIKLDENENKARENYHNFQYLWGDGTIYYIFPHDKYFEIGINIDTEYYNYLKEMDLL